MICLKACFLRPGKKIPDLINSVFTSVLACIIYDLVVMHEGSFLEHKRRIRVARGAAKSNSR